jgi:hypothetical protein
MSKRTVTGPVESGFWQENEQTYHAAIKGETDYVAIKKDTEVLDDKDEKLTLPQLGTSGDWQEPNDYRRGLIWKIHTRVCRH